MESKTFETSFLSGWDPDPRTPVGVVERATAVGAEDEILIGFAQVLTEFFEVIAEPHGTTEHTTSCIGFRECEGAVTTDLAVHGDGAGGEVHSVNGESGDL